MFKNKNPHVSQRRDSNQIDNEKIILYLNISPNISLKPSGIS